MMSRLRTILAALPPAIAATALAVATANAESNFTMLTFHERAEDKIVCPARFICDVTLQPGEIVHDGFAGVSTGWSPSITYSGTGPNGTGPKLPHLLFRPARAGLRTNLVVPTSRRSYYFALTSDDESRARYYTYSFANVFIVRDLTRRSPEAIATPAPADEISRCLPGVHYTYDFDRNLAADHPTNATTNQLEISSLWQPSACTDGAHTFVQFPPSPIVPSDYPVLQIVGPDGDRQANLTYDALKRRIRIDAVPDRFVLLFGSQFSPIRLVIERVRNEGTTIDPARTPTIEKKP